MYGACLLRAGHQVCFAVTRQTVLRPHALMLWVLRTVVQQIPRHLACWSAAQAGVLTSWPSLQLLFLLW